MAITKCNEFKADLEKSALGDKSKIEIGGGRYFKYYSGQHIDVNSQANDKIQEAINSFFKGGDNDIKDGFKSLISGALETLIHNTSIGEHAEDMFFVYPENNAIIRLDVKTYKYTFLTKGLIADCENLFCYTMAKSIIDHTQLKLDELLYFVTDMSGSDGNIEVVENFISKITEIWKKLQSLDTKTVLHNYQISHLKSEIPQTMLQSKKFLGTNNITESADDLINYAKRLGWQATTDASGKSKLIKIEKDGAYETTVENYQESIENSFELIRLTELQNKQRC